MKQLTAKNREQGELPRFVILFHKVNNLTMPGRQNHWDLMLESDGKLLTWEIKSKPTIDQRLDARKIQDHRLEYLDYEGEVSGNRGNVSKFAKGNFVFIAKTSNRMECELSGELNCKIVIEKTNVEEDDDRWSLVLIGTTSPLTDLPQPRDK